MYGYCEEKIDCGHSWDLQLKGWNYYSKELKSVTSFN